MPAVVYLALRACIVSLNWPFILQGPAIWLYHQVTDNALEVPLAYSSKHLY